jgi:hypothetical protein
MNVSDSLNPTAKGAGSMGGPAFLRPQVELVRPRALVPLGERAYRAVCFAFGRQLLPFRMAVEAPTRQFSPKAFAPSPCTTAVHGFLPEPACSNVTAQTGVVSDWLWARRPDLRGEAGHVVAPLLRDVCGGQPQPPEFNEFGINGPAYHLLIHFVRGSKQEVTGFEVNAEGTRHHFLQKRFPEVAARRT